LIFRSGLIIPVRLVTVEGDPMTTVQWELPRQPLAPPPRPLSEQPPKFNAAQTYTGYTLTVEGSDRLTPPWMPVAVLDDGSNTLIKFSSALDWTRSPVGVGLANNGKPNLTQSRLWSRPDAPEQGAWLFVQGLWPALRLKDSAGLTVKVVRQVPPGAVEVSHAAH